MSRFNKLAENWDAEPRRLQQAEKIYKAIAEKTDINAKNNVLDIGTGTGLLLMHFIPDVKKITGIDNSPGMINVLTEKLKKNKIKNAECLLFDAEKDILPENTYDLVVSSMTFHHIENIKDFLKVVYNSIKNEGELCIGDLETEDGSFHSDPDESIKHLGFDKTNFSEMLIETGFKNVTCETIFNIEKQGKKYPVFLAYGKK